MPDFGQDFTGTKLDRKGKRLYRENMDLAPVIIRQLIEKAKQAQAQAYAPYSRFPVGAAILADNGRVFTGCNVENASFGLTICAERNAIAATVLAGARPVAVAIVGNQHDLLPCGACRQVLAEFNPDLLVVTQDANHKTQVRSLRELLPGAFTLRET